MSLRMKELPTSERPYEKLELYGQKKLSNAELLAIIIKIGTKEESAITIAQKVLNLNKENNTNDFRFLQDMSIEELSKIKGIGKVKAIQILAACEIARRISMPTNNQNIQIKNSQDVADLLMNELRYEKREVAKIILLNSKNILLKILDISYGGTNFAMLEPKDVFQEAIKIGAPKIIVVHNHPSGDPKPSKDDIGLTKRLISSSEILGLSLLDHVIIAENGCDSVMLYIKKEKNGT